MASTKAIKRMDGWQYRDGRMTAAKTSVVIEQEFPIYVNGKLLVTAAITPTLLKEFAVGHLFGQGFINGIDEVTTLEILNNTAHITLKDKRKTIADAAKTSYRIVSGGGRSAYFEEVNLPENKSDVVVNKRAVFSAMNQVFKNAVLYAETEGVHAAGLFNTRSSPICMIEGIGRHNTLDKIIGYALLHKIDCSRLFLVTTGRITSEMAAKICRSGIPIVAARAAVTDKALETGKKYGLTIIGFVRTVSSKLSTDTSVKAPTKNSLKIYCNAARIRSA